MIAASLKRQMTLKRIIIVAYVLSVLTIAGMAKASDALTMSVTRVEFDQDRQSILVEGFKGNTCQGRPLPQVVSVDLRTRTVVMRVISRATEIDNCVEQLGGSYELVVGLPILNLPPHMTFTVHFLGSQSVAPLDITNEGMPSGFPFSSKELVGILIQEGEQFSLQTRSENLKVVPNDQIDLRRYAGELVEVSGHEIGFGLMPVDETLLDNGELPKSLIITGITVSR